MAEAKQMSIKDIKGVSDLISVSWELFARNFVFILMLSVLTAAILSAVDPYLVDITTELDKAALNESSDVPQAFTDAAVALVGMGIALTVVYYIAIVAVMGIVDKREQYTLIEAWSEARPHLLPLFLMSVVVSIVIILGFIALIVPGILFAIWYMFTPYVRVDMPKASIREVMAESKRLLRTDKGIIMRWFLLSFGLSIGASLVTFPVTNLLAELDQAGVFITNILTGLVNNFFFLSFIVLYYFLKGKAGKPAKEAK